MKAVRAPSYSTLKKQYFNLLPLITARISAHSQNGFYKVRCLLQTGINSQNRKKAEPKITDLN
jgi:hypothetical protein